MLLNPGRNRAFDLPVNFEGNFCILDSFGVLIEFVEGQAELNSAFPSPLLSPISRAMTRRCS
jgi:hypothetical protein